MVSSVLANRVRVATATTGTGTVTLGAKVSNKYATFAEAGITNGQVVTYCIEEGNDWEIGRGTYTSSGTTLSRDTVLISSIGGTVGTTKLTLAGAAEVFISASKEDFDVNDFTEDTSPDGAADFHWMYDASASLKKKVKPSNVSRTGGLQLLTSGTVSAAATLDIVLTGYTGYRALKFVLSGFVPATDDVDLWMRFSTDGGSSYDATGYSWVAWGMRDSSASLQTFNSTGRTEIVVAGSTVATLGVSNVANEGGAHCEITLHRQTAAVWSRARFNSAWTSANSETHALQGSGTREAAQDTDAVRFLFESGNITEGNYAVYGLV